MKTNSDQTQINDLQHFQVFLDCQNNHYEVDLLRNSTFKRISYSSWIKNNTEQNPSNKKCTLIEVKNLTDKLNLSGFTDTEPNYTVNQFFNLHDPLENIPLSKLETENIFCQIQRI